MSENLGSRGVCMNNAILLSGGIGSRIHSKIPKQYISVSNKLIISYALDTIVNSPWIDGIYIVTDESWRDSIIEDAKRNNIMLDKVLDFVDSGMNRQESIWNGLNAIANKNMEMFGTNYEADDCLVFIHDAARPLLTFGQIEKCFKAIDEYDGVMPVIPMKDTVYFSEDGGTISKLLERSKIYAGQAPELFRFSKYLSANQKLFPNKIKDINGSTEPAIMDGMKIAMVEGDENNYKITTDMDLKRFIQSIT